MDVAISAKHIDGNCKMSTPRKEKPYTWWQVLDAKNGHGHAEEEK